MPSTEPSPSAPRRRPGVPARPPFAFRMTAPAGWETLRGDSRSLQDDLVALIARTPLWAALDDRRRRGAATLLGGVARASAATGAVATLLRMPAAGSVRPGQEPEVSSISLTWLRTAPVRADLDLARLVVRGGEPVDAGTGPALLVVRVEETVTGADQVTVQVAAPVPDSIWLAVLTGTTTAREHLPALEEAVRAVAASLEVDRPERAARADRAAHAKRAADAEAPAPEAGPAAAGPTPPSATEG